jgi:EAL domain-containing protein (putative c-di-GMP-specific phosphodiesterase class I)
MSEPEFLTDPCPIELESVWGMARNSLAAETVQPPPTPAPGSLASLRKAIQNRELELSFQPIVHLDSRRPAGLEGHLTWVDPEWGGRQTSSFGPLADRQGLAPTLIRAQFAQACRLVETFSRLPVEKRSIFVTLKVPTRHLADRSVIDDIVEVLGGTAVDPSRLVVEMTDLTSMAGRHGVRRAVVTLREAGIRVPSLNSARKHLRSGTCASCRSRT